MSEIHEGLHPKGTKYLCGRFGFLPHIKDRVGNLRLLRQVQLLWSSSCKIDLQTGEIDEELLEALLDVYCPPNIHAA
jgi:hypothetical protein